MGDNDNNGVNSAFAVLVQSLIGEVRDLSVALAMSVSDQRALRDDVKSLLSIVKDGGSSEPLITKVALLEQSIDEIEGVTIKVIRDDLEKVITKLAESIDPKTMLIETNKDKRESRAERLRFWGTIITAVISLGIAAIALLK